jgi:rubrerythrin
MTDNFQTNLALAFTNMSKSAILLKLYARKVKREGKTSLTKVLSALAQSENIHAHRSLMYLRGKVRNTNDYLDNLMKSKHNDAASEFPQLSKQLSRAGKKKAGETFEQFASVASIHLRLLNEVLTGNISDSTNYYICQICGYIAKNEPPNNCPVCNAVKDKFKIEA